MTQREIWWVVEGGLSRKRGEQTTGSGEICRSLSQARLATPMDAIDGMQRCAWSVVGFPGRLLRCQFCPDIQVVWADVCVCGGKWQPWWLVGLLRIISPNIGCPGLDP